MSTRAGMHVALVFLLLSIPLWPQALLIQGRPVTGEVKASAAVAFSVQMNAGETAWLSLKQYTADLRVRVIYAETPSEIPDAFDFGPDPITLIAVQTSVHTIEIRCANRCDLAARYLLELVSVHPVSERDHQRIRAAGLAAGVRASAGAGQAVTQWLTQAEEALRLFGDAGDTASEAGVLSLLGVGYFGADQYSQAESMFRKALDLPRPRDAAVEADLLHNIAICRKYQDFPDQAVEYYRRARDQWRSLAIRTPGEGSTLSSLGVLLCEMGECNEAVEYHRESMVTLHGFGDPNMSGLAAHNLGAAYMVLGDNTAASRYIEASLPLFRAAKNAQRELSRALMNLGLVRMEQQRYTEARTLIRDGLALLTTSSRARADGLAYLCKVETLMDQAAGGEALCREALGTYRKTPDRRGESAALHNLGVSLARQKKWNEAAENLAAALEIRRGSRMPAGMIETLTRLAEVEIARDHLTEAAALAAEAVKETESVRARVTAERLRTSWFAARQSSYETHIEVLMLLHAKSPTEGYHIQALELAERRRARTLLDMLGELQKELRGFTEPALLAKQRELARRINYLSTQKSQLELQRDSGDRLRPLMRQIDDALHELELLEARVRAADPRSSEILQPPSPDVETIRKELGPRDALVEYSLGREQSFVWVLTREGLEAVPLAKRDRIESLSLQAGDLASRFRERQQKPALEQRYQEVLAALRREVFRPIAKYTAGRRIVLVADGGLQLVPFAALPGGSREIVQLPSAWTLVAKRANYPAARKSSRIAIYADPVFDAGDPRVTPGAGRTGGLALPRLPFSRQEAKAIESLVGPEMRDAALDFAASKGSFLSSRMQAYRYIHVSSHAMVDTERPELSSIVLSQVDQRGRAVDGRVRMYELYNLRTSADLVTLSACQTGVGKPVRGEGLVGLTRAFLFAGARSVLVTLWPVEDEGTAVFMREFYQRLLAKPSLRPAAALRGAQEWMAQSDRWKDPYYWAGFVLQGDWR